MSNTDVLQIVIEDILFDIMDSGVYTDLNVSELIRAYEILDLPVPNELIAFISDSS